MAERRAWAPWALWFGLFGFCLAGPLLWRADPFALDAQAVLLPPAWAHPAGTDDLGRDSLARVMQGGGVTLAVSLAAAAIAFVVALGYGLAAALAPAWLDRVLMRLLDAILALPPLVVLIAATALVAPSGLALPALIGAVAWPPLARLIRNEAAALQRRDYVLAARQLGAGPWRVAATHIVPVMARLLAVNATFLLADAVLAVSALSFLGLGVQPPQASWGQLLAEGMGFAALHAWWLVLPPALLIVATLFAADWTGRSLPGRR